MTTDLAQAPDDTLTVSTYSIPSPGWNDFCDAHGQLGFHYRSEWPLTLQQSMGQVPYFLTARDASGIRGVLPLVYIKSALFGRFLVSLPYYNTAGVLADDDESATKLLDTATALADRLKVKNLELRHESRFTHERLNAELTEKVHMRVPLPTSEEQYFDGLKSKVRSQIRKPLNDDTNEVTWGGREQIDDFYRVFSRNMRDLGTPTYPKSLFTAIFDAFPDRVEFCCVRHAGTPAAAAMLVHGPDSTEVPSAGSLIEFRPTAVNMLMYWSLIRRTITRGQQVFDFGRSTPGSGTWRFKKQWGAEDEPAVWQYYVRQGDATQMRPDNGKFDLFIRCWKKLPVGMSRWLGPKIIRGVP